MISDQSLGKAEEQLSVPRAVWQKPGAKKEP